MAEAEAAARATGQAPPSAVMGGALDPSMFMCEAMGVGSGGTAAGAADADAS